MMGASRDSCYRIKERYHTGGEEALREISRRKPIPKNRVASEVEAAVVEMAIDYPAYGQEKVSNALHRKELFLSLRRGLGVFGNATTCGLPKNS